MSSWVFIYEVHPPTQGLLQLFFFSVPTSTVPTPSLCRNCFLGWRLPFLYGERISVWSWLGHNSFGFGHHAGWLKFDKGNGTLDHSPKTVRGNTWCGNAKGLTGIEFLPRGLQPIPGPKEEKQ